MCSGVSESGSPAPKLDVDAVGELAAFAVTAKVIDGLMGSRRDAILIGVGWFTSCTSPERRRDRSGRTVHVATGLATSFTATS
jgi:hypothetical protein